MNSNNTDQRIGSYYQRVIRKYDPKRTVNPAGVEGLMIGQYSTLNHLSADDFRREIRIARECEKAQPGFLESVAKSYGMADDFAAWEKA